MSDGRFIVGLGTGRCGTASLAYLLGLQMGVLAGHERKPPLVWKGETVPNRHLKPQLAVIADIGFYYLPYIPFLAGLYGDGIRFICLRRNIEDTVASFLKNGNSAWFAGNEPGWAQSFPTYEGLEFAEAVRKYWHEYNRIAIDHERRFPQFRIFDMDALNCKEGVADILAHANIERPNVEPNIHVRHG